MVLTELDRINRERSKLVQKISIVETDVSSMQHKLNSEDQADKMNNDLQLSVNGERDGNVDVKQKIAETDYARTDAIQKLRQLQGERERRCNMNETLKDDLHSKMKLCKELEE